MDRLPRLLSLSLSLVVIHPATSHLSYTLQSFIPHLTVFPPYSPYTIVGGGLSRPQPLGNAKRRNNFSQLSIFLCFTVLLSNNSDDFPRSFTIRLSLVWSKPRSHFSKSLPVETARTTESNSARNRIEDQPSTREAAEIQVRTWIYETFFASNKFRNNSKRRNKLQRDNE